MEKRERDEMKACLYYFKERCVFEKLFKGFYKKYESLGHIGGTVVLEHLSREEREQLGGFLGKDYYGKKRVSVSSQLFEEALGKSKFSGIIFYEILENYFGMPLVAKKEKKEQEEREQGLFFEQMLRYAENLEKHLASGWFRACMEEKNVTFQYMEREWRKNEKVLASALQMVFRAGENLPYLNGDYELLPVFAARLTKDPHAFDSGTMAHYLLVSYLGYLFQDSREEDVSRTEKEWTLFYRGGILKDELSNFVLLYGFRGVLKDGGFHAGLEGFWHQREPVLVTLLSLSRMERLYPGNERTGDVPMAHESKNDRECPLRIYMVENPAVFSFLCKRYPEESFICGNGQQRMAVWTLLLKLPEKVLVFYAGDFDPEGLGIAQRLKKRFPEKVHLWNYEVELYRKYLTTHRISERSLKKLEDIDLPELMELCRCMKEEKMAVYQESLLEEYMIHQPKVHLHS